MTYEEILEQLVNAVFTGDHRRELLSAIDDLSAPAPDRGSDKEEGKGPVQGTSGTQQATHTRSTTSTPRIS
jgi:hypothetical protein